MTDFSMQYGLSLYSLCKDDGITDKAKDDLTLVLYVLKENPDYIKLLDSPMIDTKKRCAFADEAFSCNVCDYVLSFIKILCEKHAVFEFENCTEAFFNQYNKDNNIETAVAVTAHPLSDELKDKLTKKLSAAIGKTVVLENEVDKNIVGGLVVRFADKQIDASIKSRLDGIRKQLNGGVM